MEFVMQVSWCFRSDTQHETNGHIREDLIMKSMHLKRWERWIEMGGEIDDFYTSLNII